VDATSKNIAQHPLKGADGAVDPVPKNRFQKIVLVINLPPRLRLQGGYRIFIFSAAATPPNLTRLRLRPTRHVGDAPIPSTALLV
jgi:hypothetical protein